MQSVLIAEKGKTTQTFDTASRRIPVTTLTVSSLHLVDVKTKEKHGYNAVKLAAGTAKKIDKPMAGVLKKVGITAVPRRVKEIRLKQTTDRMSIVQTENQFGLQVGEHMLTVGSALNPEVLFKVGDRVDVSAVSKGKGFQGGVKRHGFSGGPKTHGQSDRHRAPGSIGSGTTPGRVRKGLRMAGRMGGKNTTVKGLRVIAMTDKTIAVKGLVPGVPGTSVVVQLAS